MNNDHPELPSTWSDADRDHYTAAVEILLEHGRRMTPEKAHRRAVEQVERWRLPPAWQPGELF